MFEKAKWIASEYDEGAASLFRKVFTVSKFERAEIAVVGLGFYTLTINGERVSDELLTPPFTAYDKRVIYQTYDVTNALKVGENVAEIECGHGWYAMIEPDTWGFERAPWISEPKAIAQLTIDGKTALVTDSSWTSVKSRTRYNSLRCGETYDATVERKEIGAVHVCHSPGGELVRQCSPAVKLSEIRAGELVESREDGELVTELYDFGASVTGNAELVAVGDRGDEVRILYCEKRGEGVQLNRSEIDVYVRCKGGSRFAEDRYILGGDGEERWHGEFAFHGFRYAWVSRPRSTKIILLTARGFNTQLNRRGDYECDDERINALHAACLRSTLTNFIHIPTDCPHREKNGWTADAFLSSYQTVYNFDVKDAYVKWLDDIVDTQRPSGQISCIAPTCGWGYEWGDGVTWDAALFVIPWNIYLFYGDKSVLERYASPMKKYLAYLEKTTDDDVFSIGLGDWCPTPGAALIETSAILTCFAKKVYDIYSAACEALGNESEAARAAKRSQEIKKAFNARFNNHSPAQGYYAAIVWFDMTDDKQSAADELARLVKADGQLNGGIFSAMIVPEVLRDYGYFDLAWSLVTREEYPSWLNMLSDGSGTLWERWDGKDSRNHHMFSTVDAFAFSSLTGLRADSARAGFESFTLRPYFPSGINAFKAYFELGCGKVTVERDGSKFKVGVPRGVTASIELGGEIKSLAAGENVFDIPRT